jgi:hypothetical protein
MGRPDAGTPTCEACPAIDVRVWQRQGLLRPGQSFTCSWSRAEESCGSISVRTEPSGVVLSFQARDWESDAWKLVRQRVPIAWTVCHFGGHRPWFCCAAYSNGHPCGRRAARLYLAASPCFACRRCYQLLYASQLESLRCRGLGRARKIRVRLGGGADLVGPFPAKPKGMHWRTYDRLRHVHDVAIGRF